VGGEFSSIQWNYLKARHASVQMYGCQTTTQSQNNRAEISPPVKFPPQTPSADVWTPPPPIWNTNTIKDCT